MKQLVLSMLVATSATWGLSGCGESNQATSEGQVAAKTQSSNKQDAKSQNKSSARVEIEGVSFIEEVAPQSAKISIPYQKYQLDNGLTILLHEDKSDPLVHVDVTYHVGSGREEIGKSGFAHFFEHMMFQGSEHVADEQHFKLVTEVGGSLNGSTNTDRTNYYQTVPANNLESMLWLESDRMGFLLDAVTQAKFEVQRETVKNERGERVDNQPYGRLNERINEALYPKGHPYSWPTIGYIEDLNRVNVNDLKQFFLRWYGPNNATLTIGGDLDVAKTLKLIVKYFGAIPRGPEVEMPKKEPVVLTADRYISMEDNVHLPLVYMAFPTVSGRHPDEAPLDILSEILGGGKTSLLYKNLVKNQLAVQAQTSHPCSELACRFNVLALPHPASGKSLADLEKIMRDTLVEFETRGVQEDDLIKVKSAMEANFIFGMQSVAGKVSTLASNQTFTGNPNFIAQDIERYNSVTKADVMRVFNKYIKGKHAVIMSVVPPGQLANIAKADNFKFERTLLSGESATKASDLALRPVKKHFDRSKQPQAEVSASVDVPDFWRTQLSNGIRILGADNEETPTTSFLLKIPAGHYYESMDKAGTANMLAAMFSESTLRHSGEQMSQRLEKLGSSIRFEAGNNYINISVNTLTKHFDATMEILRERLFEPGFKPEDFKRLQKQGLQVIQNSWKSPDYLAAAAYIKLMFGDSIAGTPRIGTMDTMSQLTVADVKAFYTEFIRPSKAQLIVVSDLPKDRLIQGLKVLEPWQGESKALDLSLPVPIGKSTNNKVVAYVVDKKDAAQSVIRIGKRGMKMDVTGEYYRANLMNFALGGTFNSRINLNLREDKGYTYGARTTFWGDHNAGGFTASASVRGDVTDLALVELMKELNQYHEKGITVDELTFTRNAINQKDALKYETPSAKLGFMAQILEHDLSPDFVKERSEILSNITQAEINQLASKHLDVDSMLVLVVGDAAKIKPKLAELGYQVEDLSL